MAAPVEGRAPAEGLRRILIIEDNEKLAVGLTNNLRFEGYHTQVASDATTGLAAARPERPDLIILDLMLPDRDGYEVLRELRAAGDTTPVLVVTALGEEADKVRGFRFGADDYVTKPFGLMESGPDRCAAPPRATAGAPIGAGPTSRARTAGLAGDSSVQPHGHSGRRRRAATADGVRLVDCATQPTRPAGHAHGVATRRLGVPRRCHESNGRYPYRRAEAQAGARSSQPAIHPYGPQGRVSAGYHLSIPPF